MLTDIENLSQAYIKPKDALNAGLMGVIYEPSGEKSNFEYISSLLIYGHTRMFIHFISLLGIPKQPIVLCLFIIAVKQNNKIVALFLIGQMRLLVCQTALASNMKMDDLVKETLEKRYDYLTLTCPNDSIRYDWQ